MKRLFAYIFYYGCAKHLPRSYSWGFVGKASAYLRHVCAVCLFSSSAEGCGVERGADFGGGRNVHAAPFGQVGENARFMGEGKIFIGSHAMMGPDVMILTSDHKMNKEGFDGYVSGDVTIGDYAWIGARVIILKGVTIGKHAVIGAGAVVTKDVGDYEIWGGNPARLLKKRDSHD